MRFANRAARMGRLLVIPAIALTLTACASGGPSSAGASAGSPEPSGAVVRGDVPDNAVFLRYRGSSPSFSIEFVQGWQVTPKPDGVTIRDKDSTETVAIGPQQADVQGYVNSTDLPTLQSQAGFQLVKHDTVAIGSSSYVHLLYHVTSPPDPVTGKQVPLTVDRYYVGGTAALAIVSFATPDGVDNIDAFLRMITSFAWS